MGKKIRILNQNYKVRRIHTIDVFEVDGIKFAIHEPYNQTWYNKDWFELTHLPTGLACTNNRYFEKNECYFLAIIITMAHPTFKRRIAGAIRKLRNRKIKHPLN